MKFKILFIWIISWITCQADLIKIGLIGLDTSHAIKFTEILNDQQHPKHVPGAKVIAAFKGGSPDIDVSKNRVDGFTETLQTKHKVKIYSTIEEMCKNVDAVLLTSVDGRTHLKQAIPVFKANKLVFIDKPLAASYQDAMKIDAWSKKYNTPYFSCSSLRYHPTVQKWKNKRSELQGAIVHGPVKIEPTHPDLFWYGIHPIEALFTVMGPGVKTVTRTSTPLTEIVTGVWSGGRTGTLIGHKQGSYKYKLDIYGKKILQSESIGSDYSYMLKDIINFFKTGHVPIDPKISQEILAFMETADLSKAQQGQPVSLQKIVSNNEGK